MIRRCNYTGRKRIPQKQIRIRVDEEAKKFEASWNLEGTEMPASAEVWVEAFTSGSPSTERFAYGTVGTPRPGASDRSLRMLELEAVGFNFKVVDTGENIGRLLGIARNIRPVGDDGEAGQQSILPVNPTDLGQQVWRVNFSHERPWLEVNNRIPEIMQIAREDRKFFSLVYPAVIRQILSRVLIVEEWTDPDGQADNWRVQWLKWGIHWHPDKERPVEGAAQECTEEWLRWIEDVVAAFCRMHDACDKFTAPKEEEV